MDATQVKAITNESALRLRVLHIEDNPSDALIFRTLLKMADAELDLVGAACTLKAGLDQSDQVGVDCIIADLNLPDSDGLDVVHRLMQKNPEIPLIVLTSTNEVELGREAIAAGAQDYLIKESLNGDALSRVIRFAVERMRLRARHAEVRRRMQQDLRHKERVLQLSRRLHKVRSLSAFLNEFKASFNQFFEAGLFSLFVFKPSTGWSLGCHNHPYWHNEKKEQLRLKGIMAESVAHGRPIAYKQMTASPFGAPNAHRYVSDNAITLPLKVDDQLVGVLNLNDNPSENFEDEALSNITNPISPTWPSISA
jgi:DNA-binding NarL/FixJ family response regulator